MKRCFHSFSVFYRRAFPLLCLSFLLVRDIPPLNTLSLKVSARMGARQFDFIGWTLNTLGLKLAQSASTEQSYLGTDQRKQLALDYFELLDRSLKLEGQIERRFTDPNQTDPAAASRELGQQLAATRARLNEIAPLAEAVLQEQIATALADHDFGLGGQVFPPVSFHITALPGFLIISPRDRIALEAYASLEPGLTAADEAALEDRLEKELNVSALVAPLGGLGTYPTMVYETASLNITLEVGAHEWTHNYLTLRPLGVLYESAPELRVMNEVAATLAGQEIGQWVLERYYPERLPPPAREFQNPKPQTPIPDPNAFDFNTQMHETRVKVDALLAAGKIEEAEAYMEERRRIFVAHGYQLRKLNQAYFAFYGAYNVGPGAGGKDPIGPAVRALRDRSPSLKAFLDQLSWMTSFADLQKVVK